jgi:flagella basal body P-ring formation protein FlgA
MRTFLLAAAAFSLCMPGFASAAMLRPYAEITAGTVRLGDLFDGLGTTPDRVLGKAPAPGERIVVGAAQLAAIARDFNVDWRPGTGSEQAVIERRGDVLPQAAVVAALRAALFSAGAPEDAEIAMPDIQPVVIPAGAKPVPNISECSYDQAGGHFTALVTVSTPEMKPAQMRVSGSVIVLAAASVPTHRLERGAVVGPGDIEEKRVRVGMLRGNAAILSDQALGMVLKHAVAAGQPLTGLDLERPALVLRGSLVRMTLSSEGIALAAEGIAMESGAKGDRVRVQNPNSHAVVEAQVVGAGEVRVAPRAATVSLVLAQ